MGRIRNITTAHTPKPWYVTLNPFRVGHRGILGIFQLIADCKIGNIGTSEAQANARLIAAAPELLEALKVTLDIIARDPLTSSEEEVALIHKAIAKAEKGS